MTRSVALLLLGMIMITSGQSKSASTDSDWPCQQIKVPKLSLAAVWSGPDVDPGRNDWRDDPKIVDLVQTVAQRREPIDKAQALIHDIAQQAGVGKPPLLLKLLAGVFSVLDAERDSVMAGLERFGGRQKELAAAIRADNEQLHALQSDRAADPNTVQQMVQKVTWEVQVFQDRRQAILYACDTPSRIEQRLFALAHQIQQALE